MSVKHNELMWAELSPFCYGGEDCDEIVPMFYCHADGDVDSEKLSTIELCAKTLPTGTKITITVPRCPSCGLENNNTFSASLNDCECGFSWKEWTEQNYG